MTVTDPCVGEPCPPSRRAVLRVQRLLANDAGAPQRRPVRRTAAFLAVALLATSGQAQMASFKNFKHYPSSGQWQQELVGYRDGKALGAPVTSTSCAGPMDAKAAAGMAEAMKAMPQTCTTKVLADQERLGESETVCKLGAGV